MLKFVVVGLLALGISFSAMAQEPACKASWAQGQAYFAAHSQTVIELTTDQREAVQADYNSMEPKTNLVLGHVYTIALPEGEKVFVALVMGDDCVIEAGAMLRERLLSIISRHST
jgi:hypothetical protein